MTLFLRQTELHEVGGSSYLYAWLDTESHGVEVGDRVTLEEIPNREWTVKRIFSQRLEENSFNRKWGLALPKKQRLEA